MTDTAVSLNTTALPQVRERFLAACETGVIYAAIIAQPFNALPVIHDICLPLAAFSIVLLFLKNDWAAFAHFIQHFKPLLICALFFLLFCVTSILVNLPAITQSSLRGSTGLPRATSQFFLASLLLFFPFYLAFCLLRKPDWRLIVRRAIWLSMPVPMLVGFLQLANFFGVPGTGELPFVHHYEGGFWRLNSVSFEANWFDIYITVIFPFLVLDYIEARRFWNRAGAVAAIAALVLLYICGFSKAAYAAAGIQSAVTLAVILLVKRPRWLGRALAFVTMAAAWLLGIVAMLYPEKFEAMLEHWTTAVGNALSLFVPLITGNLSETDIGTRFGMAIAAINIWLAFPLFGSGIGQFAYHAAEFIPQWGVNRETAAWLGSDPMASWPSATMLFPRILAETGLLGFMAYAFIRLGLLIELVRNIAKAGRDWPFVAAAFSAATSMLVFDMSRDSFVNLSLWVTTGLSLATLGFAKPDSGLTQGVPDPGDGIP